MCMGLLVVSSSDQKAVDYYVHPESRWGCYGWTNMWGVYSRLLDSPRTDNLVVT